jgi:multicomponent Na+:H+ antiporter subunit D
VPPAAGFLGKLTVFEAGAALEALPAAVALVALVFVGSALSFLYSFQVYQRRFVAPRTETSGKPSPAAARYLVALLAAFVVLVGLWPQPLVLLCRAAAGALTGGPG